DVDYNSLQLDSFVIDKDIVHEHKTVRVNYTTYDLRREQDVVNPRSRADIMTLSQESPADNNSHPYWYARVVYIFHLNVRFRNEDPSALRQIDILLVRWLQRDTSQRCGFKARRLPRVAFYPLGSSQCWDFIDPSTVIRSAHIIPVFKRG
ncbi:hypothetical protein CONPUDRAFT_16898, partial [Coniophora puteana RWD-64-598 SS2]